MRPASERARKVREVAITEAFGDGLQRKLRAFDEAHRFGLASVVCELLPRRAFFGEPTSSMRELWRWHAAEESEHKTVPFDVFRAAGGTAFERIATMLIATAFFWAKVLQHLVVMMRADGCLWSLAEWHSPTRYLFVDPGGMRTIAWTWLQYFKPGFHPSDLDDGALLDAWRAEYELHV